MKKLIKLRLLGAIVVSLASGSVAIAVATDMGAKSMGGGNYFISPPLYFLLAKSFTA